MAIHFRGTEDISFAMSGSTVSVDTAAGRFRATHSRCGLTVSSAGTLAAPADFAAPVTNLWFTCRMVSADASAKSTDRFLRLYSAGTLVFALDLAASGVLSASKFTDGGVTPVPLGTSGAAVLTPWTSVFKLDVRVVYGASGLVQVFKDGALLWSVSGDTSLPGHSGYTNLRLHWENATGATFSEVIVADEDTRGWSLVTFAPSVATANQWAGAVGDVNETALNDATTISTAVTGSSFEASTSAPPAGTYAVKEVSMVARVKFGADYAGAGFVAKMGSGGSTADAQVVAGTKDGAFRNYLVTRPTNPQDSAAWEQADLSTLRFGFRSN